MALATVEDVKRKLHIRVSDVDTERDDWLADELDSATDWVKRVVGPDWDSATGGTKTYYDIREDASLLLPQEGCTVTAVRVSFWVDIMFATTNTNTLLLGQDYTIDDESRVLTLRPVMTEWIFENAYGKRLAREFRSVEIDWEPRTDEVPTALRDAAAIMAAGQFLSSPRLAGGITQEKMGDYSYQVRPAASGYAPGAPMSGASDYTEEAMRLLRPYIMRRPEVI